MGRLTLLALLALVAACGKKEETTTVAPGVTVTRTTSGGETATVNIAGAGTITGATGDAGMAAPVDLPTWAPVYPGAKIVSTMSGVMGAGTGKSVSMESPDPTPKVTAFYDAKLAAAGVKPTMATDAIDSAMRIVPGDKGGTAGMIAVAKADDGTGSTIMLTYGMK